MLSLPFIIILVISKEIQIENSKNSPPTFASENADFETAKHNRLRSAENNGEHLLA